MPIQGGLAQMLAEQGGDEELVKTAQDIESMPGGQELLYTYTAEQMMKGAGATDKQAKKIRLFNLGGYAQAKAHYARGGSTRQAAQKTRRAGRGDDSMMLHMSPEEYEAITSMWGEPDVNPNTGIGEYGFLSKVWKKIKKGVKKIVKSKIFQIVAPIALSIFVPGLGVAIGGMLGASGTAAGVVGNAVIQGGLGAAAGGKEGFIKGAISGAVTGGLGSAAGKSVGLTGKAADIAGSAVLEGAGSSLAGGDFTEGAISGALGASTKGAQDALIKDVQGGLGLEDTGGILARRASSGAPVQTTDAFGQPIDAPAMSPTLDRPLTADEMLAGAGARTTGDATVIPTDATAAAGRTTRTSSPTTSPVPSSQPSLMDLASKYGIPALQAYGAIAGGGGAGGEQPQLPPEFTESLDLPPAMNRRFQGPSDAESYYTYGQAGSPASGQRLFLDPQPFGGGQQSAGGLESAAATPTTPGGEQPVRIPPGRAGLVQRRQLEGQGWTFNPGTQTMHPPQGTGATNFVARGGYQRGGEFDYWDQNSEVSRESPLVAAQGNYVKGGGTGRSDDIEARLSDGEYVIDAESVALLGDGSGDAGARRLDEMRTNLRKHKGTNLKKGEFSHKAKKPTGYMGKMKRLRQAANGGTI